MKRNIYTDENLIRGLIAGMFLMTLIVFSNNAGSNNQVDNCSCFTEILEIRSEAIQVLPLLLPEFENDLIVSDNNLLRNDSDKSYIALLSNRIFHTDIKMLSKKYLQIKSKKSIISDAFIPHIQEPEEIPSLA